MSASTRALSFLLGVLIVLSFFTIGATVHVAAASGTTPTTLNASVNTTVYVNQYFTISGTLAAASSGISNQSITLWFSTDNTTWTKLYGTNTTNATGQYAFTGSKSVAGTYYYYTTYAGNTTYTNATSNVASVIVTPKIVPSLNATAPATANATQNFTVSGQLTANGTSVPYPFITLQNSTDNVTWTTVATVKASSSGRYAFTFNETAPGTFYYRTTYAGNTTLTNATSNVVSVIITP